jgi:multiple sugar transport system permease protein
MIPPTPIRFVGLDNYASLLQQARFWSVVGTTTLIAFGAGALQYVIGFGVALALHANVPGEKLFRVAFLLPMLLAPVAVALIARMMFNPTMGPLNQLMSLIGLPNLPFLTHAHWALACIVAVEVWQWTPFVILLMLAGLQTLPEDVYEAAALEGATPWQQFKDITFPMLLPISAAVVFIRLIESYKIIDTVFVMTGGGPGISTETLTLFAYQEGFKKFNLGYTSALSFLFLIVITIMGTVYLAVLRPHLEKRR